MNPDSITKLTSGLFDNVKSMKSMNNYSYDRNATNAVPYKDLNENNFDNMNKVQMHHDIPVSEQSPLFEYPREQIKEYSDNIEEQYDEAVEDVEDEAFRKQKYEMLPEVENPLENFYNDIINEKAIKRMEPKARKEMYKRKTISSSVSFLKEFDDFVKKVDKKQNKWLKEFRIFDYIIKSGKKYKVAADKNKMDKSDKPTTEKLRYLDKIIKKSKFSEQVCKKFIEKYNMTPKLITEREIVEMVKPFYEKCLVKAFEKKIKYARKAYE